MDTNMTTKTLLDEYAGCFRVVDNCESDAYICEMCKEDKERMQEIIKELEASIRKELLVDLKDFMTLENGQNIALTPFGVESFALSKQITN